MKQNNKKKNPISMKNITINLPTLYDEKIQELIEKKIIPSRSEAIRTALREFLHNEYNYNLDLLGFFDNKE
jgi:metal-responsive CopG/Arc/MetJ family transcriptional regulator